MTQKRIIVLGSTGSIGRTTLKIVETFPDEFLIVALAAHTDERGLLEQAASLPSKVSLALAGQNHPTKKIPYHGSRGLLSMIEEIDADVVVNGLSGSAGLTPSLVALETGKDLALANKESIIMGGPLLVALAEKAKGRLLPVDSEHAALSALLDHLSSPQEAVELILTASGGALRDLPREHLARVTPEEALQHPTWPMGKKITIDSATLANKGLEVMEAHYLFSVPGERIRVFIHPQSYVHALIRTEDGSLYAQISEPDMTLPLLGALRYPVLGKSPVSPLDLAGHSLTFEEVDHERFPMLSLAYHALAEGHCFCVSYNAANEIAAHGFLAHKIPFQAISHITELVLQKTERAELTSFEAIQAADGEARRWAQAFLERYTR